MSAEPERSGFAFIVSVLAFGVILVFVVAVCQSR